MLREKVNGGCNVHLTSAPTADGWLVDANMKPRSDVKFLARGGMVVNVRFEGHEFRDPTANPPTTASTARDVIDVDASPPVLQQIFAALKNQTESQRAANEETKAIFQNVVAGVNNKVAEIDEKVSALQQGYSEASTDLHVQRDSIHRLEAQHETNSDL